MPSVEECELAVAYALSPASSNEDSTAVRQQASRFLDQVKASDDGWIVALQLFATSHRPEAKFFALGVLQDFLAPRPGTPCRLGSPSDRQQVREVLLGWLSDAAVTLADTDKFLVTKVAVVLALLLKADYPERWGDAFPTLMGLLSRGPAFVELFMRFLLAVDEEIVTFHAGRPASELERSARIKDTMRATGVQSEVCGVVHTAVMAYQASNPSLAALALSVLSKYVTWIDIGLVINDRILPLLYECLGQGGRAPELAQAAASCLEEVINKGVQNLGEKLRMLGSLGLPELLQRLPREAVADEDVAEAIASLVNDLVIQLLDAWDQTATEQPTPSSSGGTDANLPGSGSSNASVAAAQLSACLPLLWAYLSHSEVSVSAKTVPAANRLVQTLKKERGGPPGKGGKPGKNKSSGSRDINMSAVSGSNATSGDVNISESGASQSSRSQLFSAISHVPRLLAVVYARMQYPEDFTFDACDEDEGEEDALRTGLRKIIVNTCRCCPDLVLQLLCEALGALPPPLSELPWPAAEAALRLVYHYGEGCTGAGGTAAAMLQEGTFPQLVVALHRSDLSRHNHPHVLMLYYDIAVRYVKILKTYPDLVPAVLEGLCGPRGLLHGDRVLRGRACYNLSRLVKALVPDIAPLAGAVVPGVVELLRRGEATAELSEESILNLYETIGCLIGMQGVPVEQQSQFLDVVLGPLLERLRQLLRELEGGGGGDEDTMGESIASCLASLANVSKGFSKPVAEPLRTTFFNELEAAISAILALPSHSGVRQRALFLIHRMVPVLEDSIIPLLGPPLLALIENCQSSDDIDSVVSLTSQISGSFGSRTTQLMDGMLLPVCRRIFDLMPSRGGADQAPGGSSNVTSGEGGGSAEGGPNNGSSAGGVKPVGGILMGAILPHEEVERTALLKQYYAFILSLLLNNMVGVLASPTNAPQLEHILQSILESTVEVTDPVAKKIGASTLSALAGELGGSTSSGDSANSLAPPVRAGITAFVCEKAAPELVSCLLPNTFDMGDANSMAVVSQVGALIHRLRSLGVDGEGYAAFQAGLQQLNCPEKEARDFISTVNLATDAQTVALELKKFVMHIRTGR